MKERDPEVAKDTDDEDDYSSTSSDEGFSRESSKEPAGADAVEKEALTSRETTLVNRSKVRKQAMISSELPPRPIAPLTSALPSSLYTRSLSILPSFSLRLPSEQQLTSS